VTEPMGGTSSRRRAVMAITADHHSGHPFGLFPGDSWELASGGNPLHANSWQRLLWDHWLGCWTQVGRLRRGARLIVVTAGDSIEGDHHETTELCTARIDEQERMFVACLRMGLRLARFDTGRGDVLRCLGGTPAHDGNGNSSAERIARMILGVKPDDKLDGAVLRKRLLLDINGCLYDIAHRGYTLGGRTWTRTNSMRAYLLSRWLECLQHGLAMPRHVIRAHRHTAGYASLENDDGETVAEAWLMPCWKLKDEYVYQIKPESVGTIGLLAFEVGEDGTSTPHRMVMRAEQDETEML